MSLKIVTVIFCVLITWTKSSPYYVDQREHSGFLCTLLVSFTVVSIVRITARIFSIFFSVRSHSMLWYCCMW